MMHPAVGCAQLERLQEFLAGMQWIFTRYTAAWTVAGTAGHPAEPGTAGAPVHRASPQ
jgi:hypothetical protein